MPSPSKYDPKKPATKPDGSINGHRVHNKILLALPSQESVALFSKLEFVSLPTPTVLNEAGETIKFAFFMNDGLASILSIMDDGKSVEVGLCGREGFVGIPLTVGFSSSPSRTIIQVAGSAFRVSAKDLVAALKESPSLAVEIQRFAQEVAFQSAQVAACNRLHEIDERLARWLLMSQDRLGGDLVPLTQEFLSHMLGTRRASVTVAAGILQKAGLITYVRGTVKIESRTRLEDAACECYGILIKQIKQWNDEVG
ncbi:MAG TPA: Crp/Fnr family transcriptional regulator [Candidatus Acidoferrum sp.]|nr:Crp/Fnr family transcriptional regulator [Candidatus Acidoferrum sp.]